MAAKIPDEFKGDPISPVVNIVKDVDGELHRTQCSEDGLPHWLEQGYVRDEDPIQ